MIALGIETSGPRGGAALVALDTAGGPARPLAIEPIEQGMRHGEALLPAIERCLARAGCPIAALDLIVAGTGPGSYTGTRIGVATARALAFANALALIGVPSFDAIAEALEPAKLGAAGELLVVRDAYQRRAYRARYRPSAPTSAATPPPGRRYERRGPIEIVALETLWDEIEPGMALIGDLAEREPDRLAARGEAPRILG